jgi:hypothetical protein
MVSTFFHVFIEPYKPLDMDFSLDELCTNDRDTMGSIYNGLFLGA